MGFSPALPLTGLAGWNMLTRTLDRQMALFGASPALQRDTDYFRAHIADVKTAQDLVGDRRLLRVALGAFGLQADIDNRAFIREILQQGTQDRGALANRLADSRYKRLATAFGFGEAAGPKTGTPGFAGDIIARFRRQRFEAAIGDQDQAMRLAMNADRQLAEIARSGSTDKTAWLQVIGDAPLRQFFETALGLPKGFVQLDLDRQVRDLQRHAARQLGIATLADLADPAMRQKAIERFHLREQVQGLGLQSGHSTALALLQSGRPGMGLPRI